jgi:hypothetical protein
MEGIAGGFHADWSVSQKIPPDNLDALPQTRIEDPITHQRISYRRFSNTQYQLCATFMLESRSIQGSNPNDPNNFWYHPKGYYCYQFDATQTVPFVANGDFSGFD